MLCELLKKPESITKLTKEELIEAYSETLQTLEVYESAKGLISEELGSRMEFDQEMVLDWTLSKAKRISFPEVTLEEARKLGAVKETKDEAVLKKLLSKGTKLPTKVTEYLLIKHRENGTETI